MKRTSLFITMIIMLITATLANAQQKNLGLGIMIGEPTGFSAKYWLNNNNALDFGLAYSFVGDNSAFSLHCDYIYHSYNVIKTRATLPIYYGFGAQLHAANKIKGSLGARGVIGLLYLPDNLPIDTFIELAPVFNVFPETSLHLNLAIGARYFIN